MRWDSISGFDAGTDAAIAHSVRVRSVAMTLCYLARCTCEQAQVLREDRYRYPSGAHEPDSAREDE
jgi:hypothetical protein